METERASRSAGERRRRLGIRVEIDDLDAATREPAGSDE